jgi:hypothetical protein
MGSYLYRLLWPRQGPVHGLLPLQAAAIMKLSAVDARSYAAS